MWFYTRVCVYVNFKDAIKNCTLLSIDFHPAKIRRKSLFMWCSTFCKPYTYFTLYSYYYDNLVIFLRFLWYHYNSFLKKSFHSCPVHSYSSQGLRILFQKPICKYHTTEHGSVREREKSMLMAKAFLLAYLSLSNTSVLC